jgi:division protein CdvB (Snf7/Vps24/ESCRT-III family)
VVLAEANAIGTAWLHAGVIGCEEGARMQRLIADYAEVRIRLYRDIRSRADGDRLDAEAARLQTELWGIAASVAQAKPNPISALMLPALNEMFDLATTHKRFFTERVSAHILRLLLWTSIQAVGAMGCNFGVIGSSASLARA